MTGNPRAYRSTDGSWKVVGGTFAWKERLKEWGGTWNPARRYWLLPSDADFPESWKVLKVRIAARCHCSAEETYADATERKQGWIRLGCGYCDTPASCGWRVPILEVLE